MHGYDEDAETTDDDFVDPSMDKYFENKKSKLPSKKEAALVVPPVANKFKRDIVFESEDEEEDLQEPDDDEDDEDDDGGEDLMADGQLGGGDGGWSKLTMKTIGQWSEKLNEDKPFATIVEVVKAFKSALLNVVPNRKIQQANDYRVEGSELFNAMVRLCMRDLLPCLLRLLNLPKMSLQSSKSSKKNGSKNGVDASKEEAEPENVLKKSDSKFRLASTGANWKKLKAPIKSYLEDMFVLASNINEPEILNVILRHVRLLINFYMCFPKLLKSLVKLLITVWSQGDEKSRVISFISLYSIAVNSHEKNQNFIFKHLYLAFARNAKFTSVNTLPMINFMQRSLIEIYAANKKLSYEHVFIYIRQLAIHLRQALSLKRKESYQAVYNWQFVHSLILWSKFLSTISSELTEELRSLIFPLTECLIGTLKLIPTPRYYPLRFHCINALILLSNSTNVFIPIIPFILEVFDITDFNKKHATISVKNLNFSFILKLSKQQLVDKAFKDMLIDVIYDHLILYLQHQSHEVAFPELVLPLIVKMKDFVKKCKNANYCKVIKGLLDKIQENSNVVDQRRNKITFQLTDIKQMDVWIQKNKEQGSPLSVWYKRYKTMRDREIMMEISQKDVISKNSVPTIQKPERPTSAQKEEEKREFGELFINLDDDSESELDFVPKKKQKTEEEATPMEEEENDSEDDFEENENKSDDDEE